MIEKKIVCPRCKVVLNVKNATNVAVKEIVCPKCGTRLKVKFQMQTPPPPAYSSNDRGETVLPSGSFNSKKKCYRLSLNGVSYELKDGMNTVGRKAETSQASVQIATASRKMSRMHARITVSRLPGGMTKVTLSNWQNKNTTTVNGIPIAEESTAMLKNGNRVKMGDVELLFEEYEA